MLLIKSGFVFLLVTMFAKHKRVVKPKESSDERRFFETIVKPALEDEATAANSPVSEKRRDAPTKFSVDKRDSVLRDAAPVIISVKCNTNDTVVIDKKQSRRTYKVLAIKDDGFGMKTIFDLLDGTIYNCRFPTKVTKYATLYDTKEAAMSERRSAHKVGVVKFTCKCIFT